MLKYSRILSPLLRRTSLKCCPVRCLETDISHSLKTADNSVISEPEWSQSSHRASSAVIMPCRPEHPNRYIAPRQAWLTNMDTVEEEKLGLLELHPSVFAAMPRMDIIFENMRWQRMIHFIDFKSDKSRADMRGGGRKPWPQKGTGRARHGSVRSPIFLKGGKAHAKWGPKTTFFMLSLPKRLMGLVSLLSCKFAQDDLVIVDSLEIPTDKSKFVEDIIEERKWGVSVLFINDCDIMPKNIALATDKMESVTLMPYYGLNVFSMLKYETLVITLEALNKIEERLVFNMNRSDQTQERFSIHKVNKSVLMNSS